MKCKVNYTSKAGGCGMRGYTASPGQLAGLDSGYNPASIRNHTGVWDREGQSHSSGAIEHWGGGWSTVFSDDYTNRITQRRQPEKIFVSCTKIKLTSWEIKVGKAEKGLSAGNFTISQKYRCTIARIFWFMVREFILSTIGFFYMMLGEFDILKPILFAEASVWFKEKGSR